MPEAIYPLCGTRAPSKEMSTLALGCFATTRTMFAPASRSETGSVPTGFPRCLMEDSWTPEVLRYLAHYVDVGCQTSSAA